MTALPELPRARWVHACWTGAAVGLAVALFLPVETLVDLAGRHFNTVRDFRGDFVRGLQTLRWAAAANAVLFAALPWILKRAEFSPSPPAPWNRTDRLPAAALYAITFLLALPGLRDSFQNDEWRTLQEYIQHGPLVIVSRSIGDNHPLYGLMAWPFVVLFGKTEVALRLPSLLLGPLGPALLYLLLRRDHGRGQAFLAALPLAAAPFLIAFSHEGRAYAALFPAILGLCLIQPAALAGPRRIWIAYIGLGIAAAYLHIYASMAVVGLSGAALLRPEGRTPSGRVRNLAALLLIGCISLLLYSPILPKFFEYSARVQGHVSYRGDLASLFSEAFVLPLSPLWALPFGLALAGGLFHSRRLSAEAVAWLVTAGLQIAVTELAGSDRTARLYGPALVLGWPVLAGGLARRAGGRLFAVVLLALSLTADVAYLRLGRRDFRRGASELARLRRPGETLAVLFDCHPMNHYLKEPAEVLRPEDLIRRAPDWFTLVDENLIRVPGVAAMADREYTVEFRLPSARGELRGYRKKVR